jgi:hypothetical protein
MRGQDAAMAAGIEPCAGLVAVSPAPTFRSAAPGGNFLHFS